MTSCDLHTDLIGADVSQRHDAESVQTAETTGWEATDRISGELQHAQLVLRAERISGNLRQSVIAEVDWSKKVKFWERVLRDVCYQVAGQRQRVQLFTNDEAEL